MHHRLDVLRSAGVRVALIFAAVETSGNICRKLGFTTICTADFYEKKTD